MPTETLPPTQKNASPPPPWQFRLWHLFALMTYVAVMLGVATWQGPETLMVTTGLGIALLSHLGAFQELQQGRRQAALVGLAWILYLVSLCTPCEREYDVFGWQAAMIYLSIPVEVIYKADASKIAPHGLPWLVCIDLSNVLQAILPLHIWRLSRGRGQMLALLSCLAMVGPWTTLALAPGLFVGYYVWCASFMVLVIALPVNRATLICMASLAILLIAIFRVVGAAP
jgi:hypothetical protein